MSFYTICNDGIEWVVSGPFSTLTAAKRYAAVHIIDRPARWDRVPEIWPEHSTRACLPTSNNQKGRCPVYGRGTTVWAFDSFRNEWVKVVK